MTATLSPIRLHREPPTPELLRRIQGPGPRYTSYPTADRFHDGFGPADLDGLVAQRLAAGDGARPLSLYVHVPFCESVCYYCACNKVITRHHERARPYLEALKVEIALMAGLLGPRRTVSQLHFGGGSPTFLSDAELGELMAAIRGAFPIEADAEISIEVDPRTVDAGRLAHLRALGFDRLSFGVQDFDERVQQAVHRVQPFEQVRALMRSAREVGFDSINADLIYGLPLQTPESFARTLERMGELRPDRIALYAYAHLPARFKPQRRIAAEDLPDGPARVAMLGAAMDAFGRQGYAYIGMDHFALPNDPLAVAQREGRLQRNFQGYSTRPECDLVGLGVSAIGRLGEGYYQNAKDILAYQSELAEGRLPVARGLVVDADDRVRHDIIMALMCHGRVNFADIDRAHGVAMREDYAAEIAALAPFCADGLAEVDDRGIRVTDAGWYVVRAIAMVFDRHLGAAGSARERFSRVV